MGHNINLASFDKSYTNRAFAFIGLQAHPFVRAKCMVCVLPAPVWP